MKKIEALREIFNIENTYSKIEKYNLGAVSKVDVEHLLQIMALKSYNLSHDLGISAVTISKFISSVFEDKPKTCEKVCSYLLSKYGYKFCAHCEEVLPFEEFNANKGTKSGLNTYCKVCHNKTNGKTQVKRTSNYRAAKLNRTVPWADEYKIKDIYTNCPEGCHVDHIIPLQGELVSGLHIESNLQYLNARDNLAKHNKYAPEA